MIEQSL